MAFFYFNYEFFQVKLEKKDVSLKIFFPNFLSINQGIQMVFLTLIMSFSMSN